MHDVNGLQALCVLSRALALSDTAALACLLDDLDWRQLSTLADRHRLSGYLYLKLQESPYRTQVPEEVLKEWKHFYLRQWTKNERLLAEMARLAKHFAQKGEEVLFFKGPLLAFRLYGRVDARAISDLDLLVRRAEDTSRIERQLQEAGYRRTSLLLWSQWLSRYFTHQFEYWKDDLPLELHWVLQQHPSLRLDLEQMWQRRIPLRYEGWEYTVLSTEDELLVQLLSIPVDLQVGKLVLRPFFEIYLMLKALAPSCDWTEFLLRREREHTRRLSINVIACTLALFDKAGELENLSRALARYQGEIHCDPLLLALQLPPSRLSLRNKLHAFVLYDSSLLTSIAWWVVSLPARLLVYRSESRHLLHRV